MLWDVSAGFGDVIPTPSDRNWLPRWSKAPAPVPKQSSGCRVGYVHLSPGQAGRRAQCWLRAVSGSEVLDGPELTVLSWPLQVDNQTEENNDMNKRRRRGFNSLHEVRVHSIGFDRGPWVATGPTALALLALLSLELLSPRLDLVEKQSGSGPRSTTY